MNESYRNCCFLGITVFSNGYSWLLNRSITALCSRVLGPALQIRIAVGRWVVVDSVASTRPKSNAPTIVGNINDICAINRCLQDSGRSGWGVNRRYSLHEVDLVIFATVGRVLCQTVGFLSCLTIPPHSTADRFPTHCRHELSVRGELRAI